MIDKLDAIRARFEELGVALTNPAIVNDNRKFSSTSKEYRSLEKIVKSMTNTATCWMIWLLTGKH